MATSLAHAAVRLGLFVSLCSVILVYYFLSYERNEAIERLNIHTNPYSTLPGHLTRKDARVKPLKAAGDSEFYRYTYRNIHINLTEKGKVLSAPRWALRKHQMPLKYLESLNASNVHQFVFVMACTADHFNESMDALWTVQEHFPTHQVMYYDWGLDAWQVEMLKPLCGVTHIVFDISAYPATKVQSGRSKYQSAKIFCIMDALISNPGVFWIDASIRFINSSVFTVLYEEVIRNEGFAFFSHADHSSFAATHRPNVQVSTNRLDAPEAAHTKEQSNAVLMYKTRKVFDNILWWWFLCSLNADCMSPILNLGCKFKGEDNRRTYAQCHRFDQSATNILAQNLYHHNDSYYNFEKQIKFHGGFDVQRDSSGLYTPKTCTY
ncbi:hypothetical protein CAPTEDRAFT_209008 [Capitella teleta]|uniref:Nucleotide-diphospho-sugar transferase domain-containing protein n=1 Tax=Capitella teleta TaxID=283909 RepID=R7V5Q8_CAPTE|nr:hypothetical protein CAPTEDRAFT_209008 [Capitella teleta]|eukprot:ELU11661.1 hypothetical protein CAPTEDRAFT_209008 [Capitella teleta]